MFYLAENYKLSKTLEQANVDKQRIDNHLHINGNINLESHLMLGCKEDLRLLFILNQTDNNVGFTYKNIFFNWWFIYMSFTK